MKQPGLAEQAAAAAEAEEDAKAKAKKAPLPAAVAKPPPPPVPTVPPIVTPSDLPGDVVAPPPKPLAKHHSYDDRTLSKTQIREFKSTSKQLRQSSSFHEHMLSKSQQSSQELPMRIDEERDAHSTSSATNTTTTNTLNSESTEPNSPQMPQRADKLVRCSPYYSSSLSSESPPNQLVQKPPRKPASQLSAGAIATSLKSPPSGNDTDSSLDVRGQEAKMRSRGYRKKRQLPAKRIRANMTAAALLEQAESSECSEGYLPEVDSGSSEYSSCQRDDQYLEFDEELEREHEQSDEYDDYPQYGGKFESLDMSDNVDEMGFPRYDRLGHITKPIYHQSMVAERPSVVQVPAAANHPMPPATGQPVKPARTKKRQLKREDSMAAGTSGCSSGAPAVQPYHGRSYCNPEESEYETRGGGLSDELANSSEDSCSGFGEGGAGAASESGTIRRGVVPRAEGQDPMPPAGVQVRQELPYPDFLSDYETEPIEYERYACGLDIRVDPPPKFHDSDELSDQ